MRIAYLFGGTYDPVALGGNAIDIREDVDGMRRLGHDVDFRSYEQGALPVATSVRSAKAKIPSAIWDTARDATLLQRNRAWHRRLQDPSLDGNALVFEYWSSESFGGPALARRLRVPYVLENVDPLTDERRAGSRSLFRRRFERDERERRRSAAALVVMSRSMGDYLVEHDGVEADRVHWLPQGVNTDLFRPAEPSEREAARGRIGVDGRPLIGFVGSLASYQRVDVLIEAVRLLAGSPHRPRLVLVGGTEERARAAGAGDDVTVLSHVDYRQVPALVGAFDVAVLPDSNWYGSPLKVLEYAAVGVPIVAPDIPAVRDLVSHPTEALLVRPGDPRELAEAIEATLDDRNSARERARCAQHKVLAQFDRAERTQRLLELCERLVEESQ